MNGETFLDLVPALARTANTVVVAVLALALWYRHRPRVHVPLMHACFAADLANVLIVEFYARSQGKGAVEQATEALAGGASALLTVHVVVSALSLVSYGVALATGWRLLRTSRGRRFHRRNAALFIALRLSSYATSFFVG